MRFFNTAGLNKPEIHYTLPPLDRVGLDEVLELNVQQKYFALHAPARPARGM